MPVERVVSYLRPVVRAWSSGSATWRWALVALAVALATGAGLPARAAPLPGGSLDVSTVQRFAAPLLIPPVMPAQGLQWDAGARRQVPYYEIELVQFDQQILPPPHGRTTVWSYAAVGHPETRSYPAFTIENLKGLPTRVKWVNGLVDQQGRYLPHLLPVDQTLHWANPGRLACMDGAAHTDCRPMEPPQTRYTGPVPMVTHVHGAHVQPDSDGYPEAWYLPAASDIPAGFAARGARFGQVPGAPREAGAATFRYRNDQPETTLWYHDHSLGMTRANVYAGPAGFYLLRDPTTRFLRLPGPAPLPRLDPNGNPLVRRLIREIPIAIQDRSFDADGSLFYPDNRDFFEGLTSGTLVNAGLLFTPEGFSDVAPIWNPEFFGNTMVVNGRTWPRLEVEPSRYRLRLLNGSNSRFLILRFEAEAVPFVQIGGDQGFLPTPVTQTRLLLGPAERADVVVDFSSLPPGTRILLENIGPDEPFGGGEPCVDGAVLGVNCDFEPSDPASTGQVMAFDVVRRLFADHSSVPASLPAAAAPPAPSRTRRISLNEEMSAVQQGCFDAEGGLIVEPGTANDPAACAAAGGALAEFGPTAAKLGVLRPDGLSTPLPWEQAITENPALGATETWEIYNFTADAHPIHLHLVSFKVVGRQALETDAEGVATQPAALVAGTARPPERWESGRKDTVIAYPGEVLRLTATFDIPGLYVWHCHILEHEDNEMMRPYCVGGQATCPVPIAAP
jgi:FtsP/CotA-like multicopper oxidase with cupredoxin domain